MAAVGGLATFSTYRKNSFNRHCDQRFNREAETVFCSSSSRFSRETGGGVAATGVIRVFIGDWPPGH